MNHSGPARGDQRKSALGAAFRRTARRIAALAAPLLLAACASVTGHRHVVPPVSADGIARAGASSVDITPPPGLPMGGHAVAGRTARGTWLRLHARAVFFEDEVGERIVLVQTDLWSMPAGLVDRVAQIVFESGGRCRTGRANILIAATHTHQSPGNFSTSPLYNGLASPEPFFDRTLFDFLASRIASAVVQACVRAVPARLSLSHATDVPGLMRNRSLPAALRDPETAALIRSNGHLPVGPLTHEYPWPDAYRAVDARLRVLHVLEAGSDRVIAVAAFVAVHPTALGHEAPVYSGDLFGVAALRVEAALGTAGSRGAVALIFNGAEGDVSPNWTTQDRRDPMRLGALLADRITASGRDRPLGTKLRHSFAVVRVAARSVFLSDAEVARTSRTAAGGLSTLGGAEDGRTKLHEEGCVEGLRRANVPDDPQGAKPTSATDGCRIPFALPSTKLITALLPAPVEVPLAVVDVGGLLLATLPGEFTVIAGRRIAGALRNAAAPSAVDIALIGLANEYLSYFTTREEYDAQHYEGSSTLYGSGSAALVQSELVRLVEGLRADADSRARSDTYAYPVGLQARHRIDGRTALLPLASDLAMLLVDVEMGPRPPAAWSSFCWDEPLGHFELRPDMPIATARVWLEAQTPDSSWRPFEMDGRPVSDDGLDIVTAIEGISDGRARTCTFWLGAGGSALPLRFRVTDLGGAQHHSEPFSKL